jgi:hypothetical protein
MQNHCMFMMHTDLVVIQCSPFLANQSTWKIARGEDLLQKLQVTKRLMLINKVTQH